jgi:threonine/homoserine/homoserine lactone efflux protein
MPRFCTASGPPIDSAAGHASNVAASTGRGAVVGVQPLFEAITWAGIAYLAFLAIEAIRWAGIAYLRFWAIEALRSAAAGWYLPFDHEKARPSVRSRAGGKDSAVARNGECRRRLS